MLRTLIMGACILRNISLLTSSVYYVSFGKLDIRRKINIIGVLEQTTTIYKHIEMRKSGLYVKNWIQLKYKLRKTVHINQVAHSHIFIQLTLFCSSSNIIHLQLLNSLRTNQYASIAVFKEKRFTQ